MATLNQFKFCRFYTLNVALRNIDEEKWDIQSTGFSNTIRWNAGHIYSTAETLLHQADSTFEKKHPEWDQFFLPGTKPSEWKEQPPSAAEIIDALKHQGRTVDIFFEEKLQNKASETFSIAGGRHTMDTVDAMLQFIVWHEGLHAELIKALHIVVMNEDS